MSLTRGFLGDKGAVEREAGHTAARMFRKMEDVISDISSKLDEIRNSSALKTGTALLSVRHNSVTPAVGRRPQINFVAGGLTSIGVVDSPADNEVIVTISAIVPPAPGADTQLVYNSGGVLFAGPEMAYAVGLDGLQLRVAGNFVLDNNPGRARLIQVEPNPTVDSSGTDLNISASSANGIGNGGNLSFAAGSADSAGNAGNVTFGAGNGPLFGSGSGGLCQAYGGQSNDPTNGGGFGAALACYPGGGDPYLGFNLWDGGSTLIQGGGASPLGTVPSNGGNVWIVPGSGSGGGASGGIYIGRANTDPVSFFGGTPAAQGLAFTQNYATASHTHNTPTASTLTDNTAGTANTTLQALTDGVIYANDVAAIRNNFADLAAMVNKLTADQLNVKQVLNAAIDDGQRVSLLA